MLLDEMTVCVTLQFIDSDGGPLNESFGVRSRRLRPAAPDSSYLASLDDYEVLPCFATRCFE